jgi:hypothetical protein
MIVAVRKLVGGGFPAATPAEELIISVAIAHVSVW